MRAILAAVALGVLAASPAAARRYKTTAEPRDGMLNVHLVSHTHDDVSWLKTYEQYLTGNNDTIQFASVQYILDTVTDELAKDPNRRFLYIEQGFFQGWWREQDADTQAKWRKYVKNGQVEFANGGWCMHDEAAAHWASMVDNTYYGHKFLLDEFDVKPRVGWQIDPFGHSSTQAWLLSAEAGFDALYFGRIDFQDRELRTNQSRMEMVWRASQSIGAPAEVFTGAFLSGNYGPPQGLCFDVNCKDGQIQDDERLEDVNVEYYVNLALTRAWEMANHTQPTGHIMWKMGSDFQYRSAGEWYKNLEKLIHYVNLRSDETGVHMLYSTPTAYTEAVHASGHTWTVKTDDFFPYRDNPHGAWTGYFSSRPALKGYIYEAGSILRAASMAVAAAGSDGSSIDPLWAAVGLTQHHDAVTGTSKQHVTYDYAKHLSKGVAAGTAAVSTAVAGAGGPAGSVFCPRLNESVCLPAQSASSAGFSVVAFNWLARPRSAVQRIPIPDSWAAAAVTSSNGSVVVSSTLTNEPVPFVSDGAARSVFFVAELPAAGFATFKVAPAPSAALPKSASAVPPVISNGLFALQFNPATGELTGATNLRAGINASLKQEWLWYNSSAGGPGWGNTGQGPNSFGQNSGAYIFRPNSSTAFPASEADAAAFVEAGATDATAAEKLQGAGRLSGSVPRSVRVTQGKNVVQVQQDFADWLTQTIRLVDGQDFAEIEATIGPVPIDGNIGREVITRFSTDIDSGKSFFTDSNAREFLERVRDFRPTYDLELYGETVTNNYYPVNAAIRVQDGSRAFSVLPDRPQAGGSLTSGQVELMAHRRILFDDARGVGEALNETVSAQYHPTFEREGHGLVIRVLYRLRLDQAASAATGYRPLIDEAFARPLTMIASPAAAAAAPRPTAQLLAAGLNWPVNAHLANFDARGNGSIVVRVTNPFQTGEGPLAVPVTVDLADLFPSKTITSVVETTLTANQPLSELNRLVWKTETGGERASPSLGRTAIEASSPDGLASVPVELKPQQVRTFMVTA
ncbi:hypothetical protein FNF27_06372 [Cafeteria roenbergensis]|uniref:Alpha-mannosidase n=1 Tax=Cafeteria roenbergensis TaxID=33653 RepID=A0A5A8E0D5_CAFRO|nr:hypothetical protein FNF27_06372 [Cafeteria roenbergensis]